MLRKFINLLQEILGDCGRAAIQTQGSTSNPFGSTFVYGYQNIAFEVDIFLGLIALPPNPFFGEPLLMNICFVVAGHEEWLYFDCNYVSIMMVIVFSGMLQLLIHYVLYIYSVIIITM